MCSRIFVDVERKLDSVSESLLSDLSTIFARFSLKIHERLNKFGHKLHKRLCVLRNTGNTDDKFVDILLDNRVFLDSCNETSSSANPAAPVVPDFKSNASQRDVNKRRSYEELKRNGYKYKSNEDEDEEDYSFEKEEENSAAAKSKGEVKQDDGNWKKNNKYESSKEQHSREDRTRDKFDKSHKNDYGKQKREQEFDSSYKSNKRDQDASGYSKKSREERDFDERKEYQQDRKHEGGKREHESDKFVRDKRSGDEYPKKFEHREFDAARYKDGSDRKDRDYEQPRYHKKDRVYEPDNGYKGKKDTSDNRDDYDYRAASKRQSYDYEDDNEAKLIVNLDAEADRFVRGRGGDKQQQGYKSAGKEYNSRPDGSYKESKYTKYQGNEYRDKKDKYQSSGDWQMQRWVRRFVVVV